MNDTNPSTCQISCDVSFLNEPISYSHFFNEYLIQNKCCILGTWVTSKWKSREDWINYKGLPDLEFLHQHFGEAMVPVADCNKEKFSAHPKCEMQMKEYLAYMRQQDGSNSQKCLYLKDWHFTKDFPNYEAYSTPPFFQSDWMNEYWDSKSEEVDDYRFVYIGTKGSWTPFHADVFRSFSWSANVCGRKKWIIFPPGEEEKLKDNYDQLAFDLLSDELKDPKKFPKVHNVKTRLEIIQEAGEVIFVPSGWHHQVFNIEDTISINHNWLNGTNVMLCWKYIKTCLQEVKAEISDCKEMEGWNVQCQMILKANSGIDYKEFYRFMHKIAEKRFLALEHLHKEKGSNRSRIDSDIGKFEAQRKESTPLPPEIPPSPGIELSVLQTALEDSGIKYDFELSDLIEKCKKAKLTPNADVCNHYLFDLIQVHKVITDMIQDEDFMSLNFDSFSQCPKRFEQRLLIAISEYINKVIQTD